MLTPWSRYALFIVLLLLAPTSASPLTAGDALDAYREALRLQAEGDEQAASTAYEQVLTLDPEHRIDFF